MNQVLLAFLTGLTTGGISCFAVQGGLLAANLGTQDKDNQKSAIVLFLTSKLVAYTLLGVLLGILGSIAVISPKLQGWMQILAGVFMLLTVGRLLDLHPIFRKLVITPPKQIFRFIRNKSINENNFSSGVLGFLTILIPCGVTQAMMLLAVSSSSAVEGGLIMFAFTLGTSPVFFALGLASSKIFQKRSLRFAASLIIFLLALTALNTGQILRGSAHTFQNYYAVITNNSASTGSVQAAATINAEGRQEVNIKVLNNGYISDTKKLKANVPVTLKLSLNNVMGCSRAFTIPEYDVFQILPENGVETIDFTPTHKGRLTYTCSMGMYTGYFDVI